MEEYQPIANQEAIVLWGNYRITVLTEYLVRIEYNSKKEFVDLPTIAIINRNLPVPDFEKNVSDSQLYIKTSFITIAVTNMIQTPNEDNFTINSTMFDWKYGDKPKNDLFGTIRTLDMVTGSTPLGPGLISRDGFAFFEDKTPYILDDGIVKKSNSEVDTYFFGYGHNYVQCIHDFLLISGKNPPIPRYAYGLWWSRYWKYTQAEMIEVADSFIRNGIPLSVYVIDMDWHITKTGNGCSGWTGTTWNLDLIPEPQKLSNTLM